MSRVSDFKLGELVWVGETGLPENQNKIATVVTRPAKFFSSDLHRYVWVRFLHNGFEDGIPLRRVSKNEEQTDA